MFGKANKQINDRIKANICDRLNKWKINLSPCWVFSWIFNIIIKYIEKQICVGNIFFVLKGISSKLFQKLIPGMGNSDIFSLPMGYFTCHFKMVNAWLEKLPWNKNLLYPLFGQTLNYSKNCRKLLLEEGQKEYIIRILRARRVLLLHHRIPGGC